MIDQKDLEFLATRGITVETYEGQLNRFKTGFPYLKLHAAATVDEGIKRLTDKEANGCVKAWKEFLAKGGKIEKFVPASGAASRMFKNIFAFADRGGAPESDFEKQYFDEIDKFAFYGELNAKCKTLYDGLDIAALKEAGRYADIAKAMLGKDGLNYGALPKGLLKFHKAVAGKTHTPVEEHLEECAQYASGSDHVARLHFTVSPEHRTEFEKLLIRVLPNYEAVWGVTYNISMSEQKSSTDTVAVDADNVPVRDDDGNLILRPAGHGALIENLNEQDADVIFVKNIDNVVPSRLRHDTVRWKKILGGYLLRVQASVARYLQKLEAHEYTDADLKSMLSFLEHTLCTVSEAASKLEGDALAAYLAKKFNRPIRCCGMVLNEGEPGGGPYLAFNRDGSYSPQILEAAQIDPNDPDAVAMMKGGTHFNPVDLVCYIKDFKGQKFDLKQFIDPDTGLISEKSKNGKAFKALELPGLWNGSMSDWNTVFVEVPIETFNPVKTVNDLLRKEHQ